LRYHRVAVLHFNFRKLGENTVYGGLNWAHPLGHHHLTSNNTAVPLIC
jgi:hypothetical protein